MLQILKWDEVRPWLKCVGLQVTEVGCVGGRTRQDLHLLCTMWIMSLRGVWLDWWWV